MVCPVLQMVFLEMFDGFVTTVLSLLSVPMVCWVSTRCGVGWPTLIDIWHCFRQLMVLEVVRVYSWLFYAAAAEFEVSAVTITLLGEKMLNHYTSSTGRDDIKSYSTAIFRRL